MPPRALFLLPLIMLAAASPGSPIQPGKWENRMELVDVTMPGAPPEIAAAMKRRPTIVTTCVTPKLAALGPQSAMNVDKKCRFLRYSVRGGRFESELLCTQPGGTMRVTSQGSYTPTSYAVTGTSVMTGRSRMTMTSRTSGRRLGPC